MASPEVQQLIDLTRGLAASVHRATDASGPGRAWRRQQRQFAERTGQEHVAAFADAYAQAVACGHCLIAADAGARLGPAARTWLAAATQEPLLRSIWRLCLTPQRSAARGGGVAAASERLAQHVQRCATRGAAHDPFGLGAEPSAWPGLDFWERFLHRYDRLARRRHGVYTTPPELARFIVHAVDESLRGEFALDQGLADLRTWGALRGGAGPSLRPGSRRSRSPFVRLLDPAMGSGVFLLETVAHLRRAWEHDHRPGDAPAWDAFVNRVILPRLWGQDVLLPAVVSAHLLLSSCLAATGYTFRHPARLELHLGNTLQTPRVGRHRLPRPSQPFTVVVGNPPFAGLSQHRAPWLARLLGGHAPDGRAVASYLRIAAAPLGERKHWLHDDYVKFLRLAHWLIEAADAGIVALVTNHAFLDNATFRGLRAAVLATFPALTVFDLHGHTRAAGHAPDGTADASVFGIEQGVAVSLLRRPLVHRARERVDYGELWGTREFKLEALGRCDLPATAPLDPQAPHYLLVPHDRRHEAEYRRGYRLPDIMPVHGTAAVTARDRFVVGFTTEELQRRLAALQDETISDAQIRQQYFTRGRSPRYPPGDTRGWSLAAARRRLRRETNLACHVRDCLYRPFDWRKIFWTPWMIDWPRPRLMENLLAGDNVALITRRQSPASQAWTFVWITDTIALDGLIRSDNRGSESVFPLYARQPGSVAGRPAEAASAPARRANFCPVFVADVARATGLRWRPRAARARAGEFTPQALLHYIYALFHAPGFRARYAAWLRVDFPRVFVPASAAVFHDLTALGSRLSAAHLLQDAAPCARQLAPSSTPPGRPRFSADAIEISATARIDGVTRAAWEFRVGSYQVCRTWLEARRGRRLADADLHRYAHLVAAVQQTLQCMQEIDRAIDAHGGWGDAFRPGTPHSSSSSASRAGS